MKGSACAGGTAPLCGQLGAPAGAVSSSPGRRDPAGACRPGSDLDLSKFRADRRSSSVSTQTMNYVGQLAGQMFVQVKELYRGLNPATLSGCIDVIVVRQPDGTLQCSPFHVRFGKMGVLRSREKVVDIEVNGEPVSLHMKLGENGEAFFMKETEEGQEVVPSHLATSPILTEGVNLMETQLGKDPAHIPEYGSGPCTPTLCPSQSVVENGTLKKRRKKRKRTKADGLKREDSRDKSEDEDIFTIDMSSDEDKKMDRSWTSPCDVLGEEPMENAFTQSKACRLSDGGQSGVQSKIQTCTLPAPVHGGLSSSCPQQSAPLQHPQTPRGPRHETPKSDSELLTKPSSREKADNPEMLWTWGELPHAAKLSFSPAEVELLVPAAVPLLATDSTPFRAISGEQASEEPLLLIPAGPELQQGATAHPVESEVVEIGMGVSFIAEGGGSPSSHPISQMDSPSKRKEKRSCHLGADGVYLDDITGLEPEVAALYFPKSAVLSRGDGAAAGRSASQSPQSVSSSGLDSGIDSFSEQIGDLPTIAISLCGGLTDSMEITKEKFQEKAVSYQQFSENPAIVDDPNLVVKIGTKYYNFTTAAPLILAIQAFQKALPKATVESITKEKMPRKGGRWWFSWRGSSVGSKPESASERGVTERREQPGKFVTVTRRKTESSSSDEDHPAVRQSAAPSQPEALLSSGTVSYQRTLRLTSEQLRNLQLKDGANDVVFSVTTQYQGTCRCVGTIYLWNWDDNIVISDIDGTITRSDTLGHILPTLGKDWTHQGIARLYHLVSQNGYKFVYCSARAIGMADMTRGYLHWVTERGVMLPQGPVLLSPSSLFSALHRRVRPACLLEVIEKKPEKFKIECLTDIKNLFCANAQPFYAAFGNRPTDVCTYKEVGVPLNRIFTVNPKGELVQEHAKTNISSYGRLCEMVDRVFPLITHGEPADTCEGVCWSVDKRSERGGFN
ncbi:phosphatidate phosphatase LPIN1-like isoform X1 [Arapaima gigas]